MPSRVDLHTHTTASDGTLSPLELLQQASVLQIQTLAISDHDSTAGYEAAAGALTSYPSLRLIPAIEINAAGSLACHLLGYFIRTESAPLQAQLQRYRSERTNRAQAMVRKLQQLGLAIEFERVQAFSHGGAIGRPHLADALMEKGYVRSRQEAFDRYLKEGGPAFIPAESPTASEAIALIRAAGGIPVLAHPSYYLSDRLLRSLEDAGLMGMEVYYPDYGKSLIRRYLDLAAQHHWVVTGGSDFHGPRTGREALGCVDVPESVVQGLLEAQAAQRKTAQGNHVTENSKVDTLNFKTGHL